MIAAVRLIRWTLAERRAPELSAPDYERAVEQSQSFEIFHERGRRLIRVLALRFQLRV